MAKKKLKQYDHFDLESTFSDMAEIVYIENPPKEKEFIIKDYDNERYQVKYIDNIVRYEVIQKLEKTTKKRWYT